MDVPFEQIKELVKLHSPDFFEVVNKYVQSSENILSACQLVGDDEIKMDMLKEFHEEFEQTRARDLALRPMIDHMGYGPSKAFVLDEMKIITERFNNLAERIRNKLKDLPN